jgi:hypothetical protein
VSQAGLIKSGGGGGGNSLLLATITLTPTEINGLASNSVPFIAAPGAGKMILMFDAFGLMTFVSSPYNTMGNLCMQYGTNAPSTGGPINFSNLQLTFTGDWTDTVAASNSNSIAANMENQPIYIGLNNDTTISGGDSPVFVGLYYLIVSLS